MEPETQTLWPGTPQWSPALSEGLQLPPAPYRDLLGFKVPSSFTVGFGALNSLDHELFGASVDPKFSTQAAHRTTVRYHCHTSAFVVQSLCY